MVFQSYALYPHMTVAGNMGFGLKMKRVDPGEIKRRVKAVAETLNISELLHRKPRELSGGQRQRVAMGRALVRDPKAFLFDEPLSNLDANLRGQMRVEIKRLHKRLGATIVYVTHDQIEAMTLADRIVLMNKGQVVQIDDPMTMYERPRTKFVAGFLGTPRMNFIPVKVIARKSGGIAVQLSREIELSLPENAGAAYARFVGRDMEVGLRAEHLIVGGDDKPGAAAFEAVIDLVEPTGAEALAFFMIGKTEVSARAMPQDIQHTGRKVRLVADMNKIYLIEPESGMVVPHPNWQVGN
jgi:multiple sugar transport system ATP-binding protein